MKKRLALEGRLRMARIWIFIVLSYFFITVSYNILPDMNYLSVENQAIMYIMLITAIFVFFVNLGTFWFPMWPIKYLLIIQAIQMTLMSFSALNPSVVLGEMEVKKLENYIAMNIIISVFQTICVMFNGILINSIFQDSKWQIRYSLVAGIFSLNFALIIINKFIIHNDMRTKAIITIVFSAIYTVVMMIAFLFIVDFLQKENQSLMQESEIQRNQFQSMFDSL